MIKVLTNWKTSLAGVLALVVYFIGPNYIWPNHPDFWRGLAFVLTTLGLIAARDGGTGSDAKGGPIDRGLKTAPSGVPVTSEIVPGMTRP